MEYIKSVGSSILVLGLIFFIFNRAIETSNYKRKAYYNLIFGIFILLILIAGFIYDLTKYSINQLPLTYFSFPSVLILLTTYQFISNFVKANKYHHNFSTFKNNIPKEVNYLYILYKYEDFFLLSKIESNYTGNITKFDKKVFFHDEMIDILIKRFNLDVFSKELIGTLRQNDKRNTNYYCYLIELNKLNGVESLNQINKYDITKIDMLPFDKNLIFRILVKDKFDIRK